MPNKKLIFFSRDLKIGGMEKALVFLLNELQSRGYNITLVLTNKAGCLLEQLNPLIKVEEYSVCQCKLVPLRKLINLFKRIIWTATHINKYDFSCNFATYLTIGSKLAEIASENSSLYVHSDYYNYFEKDIDKIKGFFYQQGIKQLKRLFFVSNEVFEPILKIFPEYKSKFSVISNLIDYSETVNLSSQRLDIIKGSKETILFIGRLEEQSKRLSRLLESFDIVCKKSSDFELWIVGDGEGYSLCQKLIAQYGLTDKVKMLGEKFNPYPYIKSADCVILTSDFEGYPVIYNECLSLSTPIITTIPVSDDIVDIRDFSIVVNKNVQSISSAILNKEYKNIKFVNLDFDNINQKRIEQIESIL